MIELVNQNYARYKDNRYEYVAIKQDNGDILVGKMDVRYKPVRNLIQTSYYRNISVEDALSIYLTESKLKQEINK